MFDIEMLKWFRDAQGISVTDVKNNPGVRDGVVGQYISGHKGLVFRSVFIGTYPGNPKELVIEKIW